MPREHENRRTCKKNKGRPDQVLRFFPLPHRCNSLRRLPRRVPDRLTLRFVSSFRFAIPENKRLEVALNIW